MTTTLTELDKKIYRFLLEKGSRGIPQNTLWKELGINNREASRSLKKLESLNLVRREPIVFNGRKTYRIVAVRKRLEELAREKSRVVKTTLSIDNFLDIPCMSCQYIMTICYEGGYYDPRNCQWLIDWVKNNINRDKGY